jgi:hypothetical protein
MRGFILLPRTLDTATAATRGATEENLGDKHVDGDGGNQR